MKHTNGPWKIGVTGQIPIPIGVDDRRWKDSRYTSICDVGGRLGVGTGDFQEDLANARLIAAAPDMYEALAEAFYAIGSVGANADTKHPLREVWEKARAAIKKAEGKQECELV